MSPDYHRAYYKAWTARNPDYRRDYYQRRKIRRAAIAAMAASEGEILKLQEKLGRRWWVRPYRRREAMTLGSVELKHTPQASYAE